MLPRNFVTWVISMTIQGLRYCLARRVSQRYYPLSNWYSGCVPTTQKCGGDATALSKAIGLTIFPFYAPALSEDYTGCHWDVCNFEVPSGRTCPKDTQRQQQFPFTTKDAVLSHYGRMDSILGNIISRPG